jgi:hypothetical protein
VGSARSRGPVVSYDLGFGPRLTYLIAPPESCQFGDRLLLLTCVPEDISAPDHETLLLFYGGFDARETMLDVTRDAAYIAAKFPPSAKDLPGSMPTIDFDPEPDDDAA